MFEGRVILSSQSAMKDVCVERRKHRFGFLNIKDGLSRGRLKNLEKLAEFEQKI